MTGTLVQLIALERSQFGIRENPVGSNRNPYSKSLGRPPEAWCMDFQQWAFHHLGIALPASTASTRTMAAAFKKEGKLYTSPKPGDLMFMGYGSSLEDIDHVGLVVSTNVPRDYCNTVDGNTTSPHAPRGSEREGLAVEPKVRYFGHDYVGQFHGIAFGRPTYGTVKPYAPPKGYKGSLSRLLKEGNQGRDVKRVQKLVGTAQDGDFGPHTKTGVEKFQHAHRITVDGICGPQFCKAAGWKWLG